MSRARILCVDDEPQVLAALGLHLRRQYDFVAADGGANGLREMATSDPFAVVVSDMRMPGMDGSAFLARACDMAPDTVRMLLTGHADVDAAIAAVNEGHVFRFLTKPCPPPTFLAAVEAAVAQHRLITAERVLCRDTLRGCVMALTDVLALASPLAFGRASRVRQVVAAVAGRLGLTESWHVEVAAMLSQLGFVVLPVQTLERLYFGDELEVADQELLDRAAAATQQLLEKIPRLDVVREILALCSGARLGPASSLGAAERALAERGAGLLRAAFDLDDLETRGSGPAHALGILQARGRRYDSAVLGALAELHADSATTQLLREVPLCGVRAGMSLAEDLKTTGGTLLVARGTVVTEGLVGRLRQYKRGAVREPVRVYAVDRAEPRAT
ncbi:MAG: response regulator [Myxococcales bacterium]|nr:response regulator [Myxococcales bacterium]